MKVLAQDLAIAIKDDSTNDPPAAPDIKPAPDAPPTTAQPDAKPDDKPEPKPKPKVDVKPRQDPRKVAEEVFDKRLDEIRRTTTPPPVPPKPDDPPKPPEPIYDESRLSPEQIEELEDARMSEKLDEKHKGRADKLLRFYKSLDEYVAAHKGEDDRTFDESDGEFVQWIKNNKPAWEPGERKRIERARIAAEAQAKVRSELEPELSRVKREALEAKVGPVIEKAVSGFESDYDKAARSDDPLAADTYAEFRASGVDMANTYLRVAHGVEQFDPSNQKHAWINGFLNHQSEHFASKGGEARVRDGKTFVTPAEFAKLYQAKDQKFRTVWTFSHQDVLTLLATETKRLADAAIKKETDRLASRGYVRVKQDAKPREEPKPTSGPKAGSTPAPGAANLSAGDDATHIGKELIATLGLKS